ncbi:MAG: polyprenyl synthetase [Verrucomicrobia bacterium]|nr:polyprenyl synthetase [Verrucomicrobiota bacterium]
MDEVRDARKSDAGATHAGRAQGCEYGVPGSREERERVRAVVREYSGRHRLVPPLTLEELKTHAGAISAEFHVAPEHLDFVTVLIGNELWSGTVAGVPYERRILLLPQCLRTRGKCKATLDEYGLVCEECGQCALGEFQREAEALGYVVLISEGTTVVTRLLEQGKVDAVIGVSCLSALERSFPHMSAEAIPGIAIPLCRDGCNATGVDVEWVHEAIRLRTEGGWAGRLDLDELKEEVQAWFTREALEKYLAGSQSRTERIALNWIAKEGKRWRPFLTASVYKALTISQAEIPESVLMTAIAVECFHKASLVHDDIEDNDAFRYGDMTLHQQHGVPIALNAGDFLIGEGYSLIVKSTDDVLQREKMFAVAAEGHRSLSLGQGEELCWVNDEEPPTPAAMLEVFKLKTAPAFEVALHLGGICAGITPQASAVLQEFSKSLGIAYQIHDDLVDFDNSQSGKGLRFSLLTAIAYENAGETEKEFIRQAWRDTLRKGGDSAEVKNLICDLHSIERARQLYEHYKNEAIRSLNPLDNAHLKGLLRRIVGRILD